MPRCVLCPQAKGTDAGAYEPLSDDDMDVETGEARVEVRQRGRRGKGELGLGSVFLCFLCGPVRIRVAPWYGIPGIAAVGGSCLQEHLSKAAVCLFGLLSYSNNTGKKLQQGSGAQLKTKSWILKKKSQMRKKGYTSIPVDTKYTGRKRKKGF